MSPSNVLSTSPPILNNLFIALIKSDNNDLNVDSLDSCGSTLSIEAKKSKNLGLLNASAKNSCISVSP